MKPRITDADYTRAARKLGISVPVIKAIAHVESAGSGFLPTGEPKILFEAHVFSRLTNRRFDRSHPNLSSRRWNRSLYGRAGIHQHHRLQKAVELDRHAALQSASWGKFQVMGFHYDELHYGTLQRFINAMFHGEPDHLDSFVRYITYYGLAGHLQRGNYPAFFNGYNGPAWAQNKYDEKFERALRRYS